MKKVLISVMLLLALAVSACSSSSDKGGNEKAPENGAAEGMIVYESENGPIEIPANPQRIVGLTNAPNLLSLGATLVGVDEWTKLNPLFTDKLEGAATVSDESLEQIIELNPDLIIAGSWMNNLDKLGEIAPTIVYTWGKLDYLTQQLEIGKVVNKEEEAQAWIDDFTSRAKAAGDEIKAKHGDEVTVSVFETDSKSFYVFGNNWARGTEILYQAMGLSMTEKVKADALGPGYYTLSQELLPDYSGDFIVLSRSAAGDSSYMNSESWKNIPAVQNNRLIEIDTEASTYSDPITLDYLLDIFHKGFLAE